ncbi:MAG TPA: PAS domain-containing protein [Pyrinomonadaceae bacterium]|nr:PAS domain-containing protein [Pyrinomonadaceae bacterium]
MSSILCLTPRSLFGVFELDTDGTVLYCGKVENSHLTELQPDLIGRNLFEELADFKDCDKLQKRFRRFVRDSRPTDNFNFSFDLGEKAVEAKIMMVRVRVRSDENNGDLIVVDIRKV